MSGKTICFLTPSNTLMYCYNVVFLFHCFLVITVILFLHFFFKIVEIWTIIKLNIKLLTSINARSDVARWSKFTLLAWEASVSQGFHSHTRRFPALGLKLWFYLFFPLKVDPLNLKSQNQAENIAVVLPNSPI